MEVNSLAKHAWCTVWNGQGIECEKCGASGFTWDLDEKLEDCPFDRIAVCIYDYVPNLTLYKSYQIHDETERYLTIEDDDGVKDEFSKMAFNIVE